MEKLTLENNQSICIQKQNMITGTNFMNICNGEKTFVPYGNGDWLMVGLTILIVVIFGWGVKKALD